MGQAGLGVGARADRSTLTLLAEQDTVVDVLAGLGLICVPLKPGERPDAIIAWSSREFLSRDPRFAILSDPTMAFLRLPITGDQVAAAMTSVGTQRRANESTLTTAVGGWRWAISQATEVLDSGTSEEAVLRVRQLVRFASRTWPRWIEQSTHLGSGIRSEERTRLRERLVTWSAVAPVMGWFEGANRGALMTNTAVDADFVAAVTLFLEVARYIEQGLVTNYSVPHLLSSIECLHRLSRALDDSAEEAAALGVPFLEVPRLTALVTSLGGDVQIVLTQLRPDVSLQDSQKTVGACERILSTFATLVEIGADTRAQLREAALGAN